MSKAILAVTLILLIFGLVVLSSAGTIEGEKRFGSAYYYLNRQLLLGVLPGLCLMFILSRIDYKTWKKFSILILLGALTLLALVFIPPFGHGLKGANRWLSVGGFSFQPSEVLKLSLIIYLAAWFGNRDDRIRNWTYGMAPFFIVLAFVAALLLFQPDIGTLVIAAGISIALYYFAGAPIKHLAIIGGIAVIAFSLMIYFEPYRWDRVKTFLNPAIEPQGISYQLNQALISIGSGGMFGVGLGKSTQKLFGFLPEIIHDSIFAVVVEELGFVGASFLIGLYLLFCFLMVWIAQNTTDKFGKLIVMGMAVWILGQAFLNIMAITGLAPLTGVPLPFVSYGGTAMMILLAGMGIVLNIAKKA